MLKNLKVLDFSRILVGNYASMMLSDLGADIIKIESLTGDETRKWGPPFINDNYLYSTYFASINRNKRSLSIDFKNKHSNKVLDTIIKNADVIIENFPAGSLDKYMLDYNSVKNVNEKIIYASVNGYGYSGSKKSDPAFDFIMQAYTGIMSVTGENGKPVKVGFPLCDILTSQLLYSAIITAILNKHLNNEGQWIKTSLLEGSIFSNPTIVSSYLNNLVDSKLLGNTHPTISPYTTFQIKSDYIALGVALDSQFEALSKILNLQQIQEYVKENFDSNSKRVMNRDILFEIIQKCLNIYVDNNSVDKLKEEFHLNKIPFSKINTMKELFEDEFIKELDIIHETSDELKLKYIKNPIQYSSIKSEKLKRPPYLGEHTKEILKELNFSDSEINFLKKERAIYFF